MQVTRSLSVLFVLCVFGYGYAAAAKKVFKIPPEVSEKIIESSLKCVSKMGLDSTVMTQLKEGKYADDDKVIQALLCMTQDVGIGYANGRVNVDKVMQDMFSNKPEIRTVMESCDKEYSKTPADNFKQFLVCFRDNAPVKVML